MLNVIFNELKRLAQNRFIRLAVIVIIFMPLLYSFLYLYAFWDPYGKLDKLPVAVVNQDKSVLYDGKYKNFGDDIVKEMKNNHDFKWSFVNYDDGLNGLKGNKYYFMIVIPKDFSKNILSVNGNTVEKAHIQYMTNDKKNFLATQLGNKAVENLTQKISDTIRKSYIDTVFSNVKNMGDGLKQASLAEKQLSDGAKMLNDGVSKLNDGINKALVGTNQFKDGLYNLSIGANNASYGASNLSNGAQILSQKLDEVDKNSNLILNGMNNLKNGLNGVKDGLDSISNSINQLKSGSTAVTNGYDQIYQSLLSFLTELDSVSNGLNSIQTNLDSAVIALNNYVDKHPEAMSDANFKTAITVVSESNLGLKQIINGLETNKAKMDALNDSLKKLDSATNNLAIGYDKLNDGVSKLQSVVTQIISGGNNLSNGISQYANGISLLNQKMGDITSGLLKLNDGLNALKQGAFSLYNGSKDLNSGLVTVSNGSKQIQMNMEKLYKNQDILYKKLKDASDKIEVMGTGDEKKRMINEPIVLDTKRLNPVANYGIGFTPYFIPLSLWVGALILFFIIDIYDKNGYKDISKASIVLGKLLSLSILGIFQSMVSGFVLIEALKLPVNNLLYYYVINAVMSVVFVFIIGFFVMLLGMAGKFFAVVLLMLQLTSSGGVFPMELEPKFFNFLNPFFPMTYGTQALREAISGSNTGLITHDLFILACFGILFMLLSILLSGKIGDKNKIDEKLSAAN
ncbi:YhgE/Pip domain-containing protein [Thermoanaerobacterium saccharolyticum]|uniref:YhgE/Pip domain-containing protein n=1 Tax=Thermoanaerobacterium saccharolyticum TaxID=28896 RepID=UPI002FDA3AF3